MRSRSLTSLLCVTLGACASNPMPEPNSVRASFDRRAQAVLVYVSNAQMPRGVWLVDAEGERISLPLTLISGPHVNYTAPPSIGLGFGVFGWNAGGGSGVDLPLGSPRPTSVDDQFVALACLVPPPDYPEHWSQYHVAVDVGSQEFEVAAPSP